jgi:hypothetical protein
MAGIRERVAAALAKHVGMAVGDRIARSLCRQPTAAAGRGALAGLLIQAFNNPNVTHCGIAEHFQRFLVGGTVEGSNRVVHAWIRLTSTPHIAQTTGS